MKWVNEVGERMWVEAWSPEYGTSYGLREDDGTFGAEEPQGEPVGEVPWAPVDPRPVACPPVAFLDGVSRVDARVFLDTGGDPAVGLCGSVGVGAMLTDGAARFGPPRISRARVFGPGVEPSAPLCIGSLAYEDRPARSATPEGIRMALERLREEAEVAMAASLAHDGWVVIADGRLRRVEPAEIVGYIKSQDGRYLGPDLAPIVGALGPGQRTPLFGLRRSHHYSWYLRLAASNGGHPWAGIVRCEVSASLPQSRVIALADLTAAHLPRFASPGYWDSRSPQNLVPIATLERRLWHLLGDREIVLRRIRAAAAAGDVS